MGTCTLAGQEKAAAPEVHPFLGQQEVEDQPDWAGEVTQAVGEVPPWGVTQTTTQGAQTGIPWSIAKLPSAHAGHRAIDPSELVQKNSGQFLEGKSSVQVVRT